MALRAVPTKTTRITGPSIAKRGLSACRKPSNCSTVTTCSKVLFAVLCRSALQVLSSVSLGRAFCLRVSLTDSAAPAGIYRIARGVSVERGELVGVCLPPSIAHGGLARGYLLKGDCPGGAEPVAKRIGALPGDLLEVRPGWVSVDGQVFANSAVSARDTIGRPLPHVLWGKRQVAPGQVWLFGFNNRRSWDARYFGPVPLSGVRGVLQPILTW